MCRRARKAARSCPSAGKGMPRRFRPRPRRALREGTSFDVPKKISKDQRKAVEQLGKAMPLEKVEPRLESITTRATSRSSSA
jgi:hypothetical protein